MSGRGILIVLIGMITISGTVTYNILNSSNSIAENLNKTYYGQNARNIAQTGVNMALRQLASNLNWRTGIPLTDLIGGKVRVRVADTTFMGASAIAIISNGYAAYGTAQETLATCVVFRRNPIEIPVTVKAAVSTNSPVQTLGNLTVDGRNHDLAGSVVASSGLPGIWTTSTLTQSGNSKIGGTAAITDYSPTKPANTNAIAVGQTWPGGYPGTPDSIMGGVDKGFPEGMLKAIAQSGLNGSQYSTTGASLTYPLRGVTYVELASGGTWQSMDLSGTGILVVHNSAKNAIMKNLNTGTFKGLIIADDIVHVHNMVIGAIIGLSPNPSEGNCLGNGSGSILFSQDALKEAVAASPPLGSSFQNIMGWWE